jgi:hypothetical protein
LDGFASVGETVLERMAVLVLIKRKDECATGAAARVTGKQILQLVKLKKTGTAERHQASK